MDLAFVCKYKDDECSMIVCIQTFRAETLANTNCLSLSCVWYIYCMTQSTLAYWTELKVLLALIVGPRKSYREHDWTIQDLLYNSASECLWHADNSGCWKERRLALWETYCWVLFGTMANPYGFPMKKSGLLQDPDLICWEIFTVKIQLNKNNSVRQTTRCSHASRAPFLW